ncbi:MAG: M20 aminoacylase family protein [Beijerinckiaceae bacterium]
MSLIDAIVRCTGEMTAVRRDIHAHPETGFQEQRTAALVAERLRAWGVDEVSTGVGRTGVVGTIRGRGPGRSIGLRADMDALPMTEETNLPYRSTHEGAFHGCGHDGHTTMLLTAARYLAQSRNFDGTVHLIFQPAEEGLGGAEAMIADGLFTRFPCDEIYGIHNSPNHELGWIGTTPGPSMAAANKFDIQITGRGAHAAMPHQGNDPVMIAAALAQSLQTIVSRNVEALKSAVISITQIHAGSAYNVIAESAMLGGTVRTFDKDVLALIRQRMQELCDGFGKAYAADVALTIHRGCEPVINTPKLAAAASDIASAIVGAANIEPNATPLMGSEDFGFYLDHVPGAFLWLGQGHGPNLHNPHYNFNDDAIPYGATLYARLAETRTRADAA